MATTPTDGTTGTNEDSTRPDGKPRTVSRHLTVPSVLLVACFAARGSAAHLTDILVRVFRSIFSLPNARSAVVQSAHHGASFPLAIPAAFVNRRSGHTTVVLTGLGLAAVGGFLFHPASQLVADGWFPVALFELAAGPSVLETSANPFVVAMGPEARARQRLDLAQSFNPFGALTGVVLGAVIILPRITPDAERDQLSGTQLADAVDRDLGVVLTPYLGIAAVLLVTWVLIASRRMPTPAEEHEHAAHGSQGRCAG